MDIEKYYKPPYSTDGIYIWTSDNNMAFSSVNDDLSDMLELIVKVANKEITESPFKSARYHKELIYVDEKPILTVRGWGHLISCGGFNLEADKAATIQDQFGEWFVKQLI